MLSYIGKALSRPEDDHLEIVARKIENEGFIYPAEKDIHPRASAYENSVLIQQNVSLVVFFDLERKQLAPALVNAEPVADGERPFSQAVPVNEYPVAITVEQNDVLLADRFFREPCCLLFLFKEALYFIYSKGI
jgi:hypothetical protein